MVFVNYFLGDKIFTLILSSQVYVLYKAIAKFLFAEKVNKDSLSLPIFSKRHNCKPYVWVCTQNSQVDSPLRRCFRGGGGGLCTWWEVPPPSRKKLQFNPKAQVFKCTLLSANDTSSQSLRMSSPEASSEHSPHHMFLVTHCRELPGMDSWLERMTLCHRVFGQGQFQLPRHLFSLESRLCSKSFIPCTLEKAPGSGKPNLLHFCFTPWETSTGQTPVQRERL